MKTLPKLALLGSLYLAQGLPFGFFGNALPALMRSRGIELHGGIERAVADPVEASRNAVAQEVGTRAVADYRELIGEIDAAIIAAPTTHHHAIGMELLGCGIPLLIEKPIALTAAQGTDLVNLARQKDVTLQVGHVERFNPALTAVAADIRDPKYIEATRTSGYAAPFAACFASTSWISVW